VKITSVRVKLAETTEVEQHILGYASIVVDDAFIIYDLKIIRGKDDKIFVAMPSRERTDRCEECGGKNNLRAHYCSKCGLELKPYQFFPGERDKVFQDTCHPLKNECRAYIEEEVLKEYEAELMWDKRQEEAEKVVI